MSVEIKFSDRLNELPPYLFLEIDKAKRAAVAQGRDVINLGIGDPDCPTPQHIIDAMKEAIQDGANHHYAFDAGLPELRNEIARWFKNRFQVGLDPETEIYPLIGSKEGLAHFPLGFVNPKDKVIITDPAYPAYRPAIQFAGGKTVPVPLKTSHNFLPDLEKIEKVNDAKMMIINYPNNPTATIATREFYTKLVQLAHKKGFILVSDMAYSEVYFDNEKPLSILEVEGAKDIAIEFHSFSKTYYMTGWRIGWACGNQKLIASLAKVKSNFDSGIFQAIQIAAIAALKSPSEITGDMRNLFQERRDYLINGLRSLGWKITPPQAAFYVWAKIPKGFSNSMDTAKSFLDKADIVITPGNGFGAAGEGYVRMALTVSKERINEAVDRLRRIL
ncbi:MAG TPA: LL-diaminopimelate aminotransferase [Candidatus Omnitrophica bacterium]|nr:MAG: LL-diaminopimelate aminotransferase [Omnitrophica WOR_2 bacterium GWA2_45_18]HBR15454.1 LL-diaminopimelate aminotransferase [Candidatus Omnitrophota bacterium]